MSVKILRNITLLFSSCIISFSAFAMRDAGGWVPPAAGVETKELVRTYRKLHKSYNENKSIQNFDAAYGDFEKAIFFPVNQRNRHTNIRNSWRTAIFLNKARAILAAFEEEIENPTLQHIAFLFENNIVPLLKNRIDLARLDKNLFDQLATRGSIKNFTSNQGLRQALNTLTGQIFQVNSDTDEVISTASGLMVHWDPINRQIYSLNKDCNSSLNSILTCAHAVSSQEDRSKFYFVQSVNLDLTTGFPKQINTEEELKQFLLSDKKSFRIGELTIKNRKNNLFSNIDLSMGQSQYFSNEDIVIGSIHLKIDQVFLSYNHDYLVSFKNNIPAMGEKYYALGYPGCNHYRLTVPVPFAPYPSVVQETGISPLFITGSIYTDDLPVKSEVDGLLTHRAPAAKGMSGGPLFHLRRNRLNIFGIITEGEGDEEKGCHWF